VVTRAARSHDRNDFAVERRPVGCEYLEMKVGGVIMPSLPGYAMALTRSMTSSMEPAM
jgi:hypothetical protein